MNRFIPFWAILSFCLFPVFTFAQETPPPDSLNMEESLELIIQIKNDSAYERYITHLKKIQDIPVYRFLRNESSDTSYYSKVINEGLDAEDSENQSTDPFYLAAKGSTDALKELTYKYPRLHLLKRSYWETLVTNVLREDFEKRLQPLIINNSNNRKKN